jgi:hypothetical protein
MNQADKVLENRCRRAAARRGMTIQKNPRRDPAALDFGHYYLWLNDDDYETFSSLADLAERLGFDQRNT